MDSVASSRRQQLVFFGSLGLWGLFVAGSLVGAGSDLWMLAAGVALAVFALAGPCRWLVRDRVSASQRYRIDAAAAVLSLVVLLVCLPLFALVSTTLGVVIMTLVEAVTLGGIVGYLVVALLETTAVPERVRGLSG